MQLSPEQLAILKKGKQPEAGQILKQWREAKGWPFRELANRMGVAEVTARSWESTKVVRWPARSQRDLLVGLMQVSLDEATEKAVYKAFTADELETVALRSQSSGNDALQVTADILNAGKAKVAITLVLAATGSLDYAQQVSKAIELFYKTDKEVHDELRLRTQRQGKQVSKRGQSFLTGEYPAYKDTTIPSDEQSLHNTPTTTDNNNTTISSDTSQTDIIDKIIDNTAAHE